VPGEKFDRVNGACSKHYGAYHSEGNNPQSGPKDISFSSASRHKDRVISEEDTQDSERLGYRYQIPGGGKKSAKLIWVRNFLQRRGRAIVRGLTKIVNLGTEGGVHFAGRTCRRFRRRDTDLCRGQKVGVISQCKRVMWKISKQVIQKPDRTVVLGFH
jgi:hypothetical protein